MKHHACDLLMLVTLCATGCSEGGTSASSVENTATAVGAASTINVVTQHNDNARTGANLQETILTTANTNTKHFGKAFTLGVDDYVYAQPLYAGGVTIPGKGAHNVLYVATMSDTVYAFDADAPAAPLWSKSLIGPNALLVNNPGDTGCGDIQSSHIGVLATPAIDLAGGTLYAMALTKDVTGAQHYSLHALDLTTGQERPNSPTVLSGISVNGTGVGNDGQGHVYFNPAIQGQRTGLLVANGNVYMAFASHCDIGPYHGWVMSFDETTLALKGVYNTTPNGNWGGVWQGGDGLAADPSGNVYLAAGNGDFTGNGGTDYGDSVIKLSSSLNLLDYFTPFNQSQLNAADWDLGSAGPSLLPGSTLALLVGKTDTLYVMDRNNLGHFNAANDSQIVQEIQLGSGGDDGREDHSAPVYWPQANGTLVYVQSANDFVHQLKLVNGQLQAVTTSADKAAGPGGGLSISANGAAAGTGIVWSLTKNGLRAYDAADVSHELWTSKIDPQDDFGTYVKFSRATVANGKVYVGTGSNQVVVYAPKTHGHHHP